MIRATPVVEKLKAILDKKNATLSGAESCTGGLVSARISALGGASSFFKGSVIAYANYAKTSALDVSEKLLQSEGAVSEPVALEMARGARDLMKSDWAFSITGIAGPTGGTPNKPVGLVWFAVVGPNVEHSEKQLFPPADRNVIQAQAADHILDLIVKLIEEN